MSRPTIAVPKGSLIRARGDIRLVRYERWECIDCVWSFGCSEVLRPPTPGNLFVWHTHLNDASEQKRQVSGEVQEHVVKPECWTALLEQDSTLDWTYETTLAPQATVTWKWWSFICDCEHSCGHLELLSYWKWNRWSWVRVEPLIQQEITSGSTVIRWLAAWGSDRPVK